MSQFIGNDGKHRFSSDKFMNGFHVQQDVPFVLSDARRISGPYGDAERQKKIYKFSANIVEINHIEHGVEHPIALLTPRCFRIPLTPRMFPVWDIVVGIFARKALLNSGWVL